MSLLLLHVLCFIAYRSTTYALKCLLDADGVLGTRIEVHHVWVFSQECLHVFLCHLPLCLSVNLISEHHEWEFFWFLWGTLVDKLILPRLEVLEALL